MGRHTGSGLSVSWCPSVSFPHCLCNKTDADKVLGWPILIAFFAWEARLPEGYALVPPSFWFIPDMSLLMFLAIGAYNQLGYSLIGFLEFWLDAKREKPIIAVVRCLPLGVTGFSVGGLIP